MDPDGQHNPEEIPNLIDPILKNRADLVVGSRYLGKSNYKVPLYVRLGEFTIRIALMSLFHQKIYNNQGGFRAFSKKVIEKIDKMYCSRMGFTTELLFKVAYHNFRIMEVPISLNSRYFGESYVNLFRITKFILSCILYFTVRNFSIDLNRNFLKKILNWFYHKIKHLKLFQ